MASYPVNTLQYWDVNESGAATGVTVKDPGTGFRLVVVGWALVDPDAGTLKLFFGTDSAANRIMNLRHGADGGESRQFPDGQGLRGSSGTILKVTSAGAVKGTVYGFVERVET